MLVLNKQTRAPKNIGYGSNITIILIILKRANIYHANSVCHSYKITFLFHKSALLLVRYEVGKLVTELFSHEECFAL